jgi:hypothetical protein
MLILYILLFGAVYLAWCDFMMDLTASMLWILCLSHRSATGMLAMIKTSVWARKLEPYLGVWRACSVQGRPKKARQVKSKVKSMLIIFVDIKGIVQKDSSWQATQLVLHTAVTCCGNYVKICEDFAPALSDNILAVSSW